MRDVEVEMVLAGWGGLGRMGEVDVEVMVGGIFCLLRSGLGGGGVVCFVCHGCTLVRSRRWVR